MTPVLKEAQGPAGFPARSPTSRLIRDLVGGHERSVEEERPLQVILRMKDSEQHDQQVQRISLLKRLLLQNELRAEDHDLS